MKRAEKTILCVHCLMQLVDIYLADLNTMPWSKFKPKATHAHPIQCMIHIPYHTLIKESNLLDFHPYIQTNLKFSLNPSIPRFLYSPVGKQWLKFFYVYVVLRKFVLPSLDN